MAKKYTLYDTIEDESIDGEMTIKEVAEYIGDTADYVYKSIRLGRLLRKRYKVEEIIDDEEKDTYAKYNPSDPFFNEWNMARARILKACGKDTSHIRYTFNWKVGKVK